MRFQRHYSDRDYLIICLIGLIVPHALEANPKQTNMVFSSSFLSKSNWSIVQDSVLKFRLLTSMLMFSASLNHGETLASWHILDTMMLMLGYNSCWLRWSCNDLAMWNVKEVILGPNVTWRNTITDHGSVNPAPPETAVQSKNSKIAFCLLVANACERMQHILHNTKCSSYCTFMQQKKEIF